MPFILVMPDLILVMPDLIGHLLDLWTNWACHPERSEGSINLTSNPTSSSSCPA